MNHNVTAKLWNDFSSDLFKFIRKRVATHEDAEDILHEIFLKIHTGIGDIRSEERIPAWIYRISRNAIIDYYRKNRNASVDLDSVSEQLTEEMKFNDSAELLRCLTPFVKKLPEKYREAFELVDLKEMPQTEYARLKGLSISGAKSRVQRARAQLRNNLYDCCNFEFNDDGGIEEVTRRSTKNEKSCNGCASGKK